MGFSIATNPASIEAQRNLNATQSMLSKSMGRLSTGMRINVAADDAAGLAISENLKAGIRSIGQAVRNANDGVSLLQVAEGGMNETSGILIRMRELAMQASTDTVGNTERGYAQTEFAQLIEEIDRIANTTEYNGTALLDGSATALDFQVGIRNTADDRITVAIDDVTATAGLGVGALNVSTKAGAQAALTTIDAGIVTVSGARANIGAFQNRLVSTVANLENANVNLSAANSRIRDTDVAAESAALTRNQILTQAGVAVLAQANQAPQFALSLLPRG